MNTTYESRSHLELLNKLKYQHTVELYNRSKHRYEYRSLGNSAVPHPLLITGINIANAHKTFQAIVNSGIRNYNTIECINFEKSIQTQLIELNIIEGLVYIKQPEKILNISDQRNFVKHIQESFPTIQFIILTFSPFILQSAKEATFISGGRFALYPKENLQFWEISKICESFLIRENEWEDVAFSDEANTLKKNFTNSLRSLDYEEAKRIYNILERKLVISSYTDKWSMGHKLSLLEKKLNSTSV